jgi:hypothetical protein
MSHVLLRCGLLIVMQSVLQFKLFTMAAQDVSCNLFHRGKPRFRSPLSPHIIQDTKKGNGHTHCQ